MVPRKAGGQGCGPRRSQRARASRGVAVAGAAETPSTAFNICSPNVSTTSVILPLTVSNQWLMVVCMLEPQQPHQSAYDWTLPNIGFTDFFLHGFPKPLSATCSVNYG